MNVELEMKVSNIWQNQNGKISLSLILVHFLFILDHNQIRLDGCE